MAIAALSVWEVRSTGDDGNGGGFVTGASGVDRSQQDAAHATLTTASVVHTTTTQVNVDAGDYTVSADDVGNLYHNTGGTSTAGVYQITAVDVGNNRWTLDRSIGTAGQTCAGAMGGARQTIASAWAQAVTGNHVWVKQATYTYTAAVTANVGIYFESYQTTRGDGGISTVTTSTDSIAFHAPSADNPHATFRKFLFTNTAATPGPWLALASFVDFWSIDCDDCFFDGFSTMVTYTNSHQVGWRMTNVDIANSTGDGIQLGSNTSNCRSFLKSVRIHHCGGRGIYSPGGAGKVISLVHVTADHNTGDGAEIELQSTGASGNVQTLEGEGCIFYANGGEGLQIVSVTGADLYGQVRMFNSISFGNTGNDFEVSTALNGAPWQLRANAYETNSGFPAGAGDVALTADPFTDGPNADFTLNATAGGGAELVDVGFPNDIPT